MLPGLVRMYDARLLDIICWCVSCSFDWLPLTNKAKITLEEDIQAIFATQAVLRVS